ncbi:stage II sporulation protein M [Paenibacillus rhizoplanae]
MRSGAFFRIHFFLNNSIKSVVIIYLGALFGLLPAFFLLINGAVIGYLIHLSAIQGQDLFTLIVKGLLPHGIIEIPAIIIACAFGLKFGSKVLSALLGSNEAEQGRDGELAGLYAADLHRLCLDRDSVICCSNHREHNYIFGFYHKNPGELCITVKPKHLNLYYGYRFSTPVNLV